jgi:hypothetical protein
MYQFWTKINRILIYGLSLLLFIITLVSGSDIATGSIQVTATVEPSLGILAETQSDSTTSFMLYCPQQSKVVCSITYLEHLARVGQISKNEVNQRSFSQTFTGQVASWLPTDKLFPSRQGNPQNCLLTIIYTEN